MHHSQRQLRPQAPPPVLLKRLGNLVEANLAHARLESAGIPAFLGEHDVFSGGSIHAGSSHGVEIYVPADHLQEALEVLEAPPDASDALAFEPIVEDPGRSLSFKAIVAATIGWLVIVVHPIGALIGIATHLYAIYLALAAVRSSLDRDLRLRLRVLTATILSLLGITASLLLLVGLFARS